MTDNKKKKKVVAVITYEGGEIFLFTTKRKAHAWLLEQGERMNEKQSWEGSSHWSSGDFDPDDDPEYIARYDIVVN